MYSIAFPDMLSSTKTNLVSDHTATTQNLITTLKSDRTSLFGDPYFGTLLKKMLFEQNSIILQDLVIDEIYSAIITFMPQIKLTRNNIKLVSSGDSIAVKIEGLNLLDYQIDTYNISLTSDEDL